MHAVNLLVSTLLATTAVYAVPTNEMTVHMDVSKIGQQVDDYNCKAAPECSSTPNLFQDCVNAMNSLNPNITYESNQANPNPSTSKAGACSGHCGIFVSSTNTQLTCQVKGDSLKLFGEFIVNHGCPNCGQFTWAGEQCAVQRAYLAQC
ncbi:hypothetical protein BT63DRAFT_443500 [Microthyrium microscopicum]|uniref:Uncharacterized protein n=1 Tax=Microthyrium microscopicum TaxID=703497 RepID=A0A6A6TYT5_9PEZI|nr:hypothetical protein BT63DRAFT_443500 [Microthyrium microscopicum]